MISESILPLIVLLHTTLQTTSVKLDQTICSVSLYKGGHNFEQDANIYQNINRKNDYIGRRTQRYH